MDLEWKEPPPEALKPQLAAGFYGKVAVELRKRPEEWALVPREFASEESAKSAAMNIRNGRMVSMPRGHYEAVTSGRQLYVRYVGPKGAETNSPRTDTRPDSADPVKVRKWAAEQGIEVSRHGRLPDALVQQYVEATRPK